MAGKPSKIGKYDVIDVLGRGGMGVVYKATDPHLNRLVAIKMMTGGFSDNPDLLKRFYREAQSTGNLQHPNIVTVYDLGDLDGSPYLVMEYLEGETLDAIINSHNPLTLLAKINFICDVCHGLAYAHHHGIVHRDVKPGNIMVLKNGSVKIVDFGIAHIGDKTVTRTGQLIGSLGYMSPEQVNGKPIDTRTDIFSTGVVLYQLLTYVLPFDGDSTAATLLKIIHDPPPPLNKFLTEVPPDLEGVILRSLAKDREERYRTVEDLGFDLAQIRDRLKEGMVEGHLLEAETLLSRGFTHKAKDLLLQVLKIDRQHTGAMRLFRTVQQNIEQEQIEVQIKQLRAQAEEAYAGQQFDSALNYVDKALNLHQTDGGLQSLRASISEAKIRAEELQRLLHKAEEAHQEGDLDIAKKLLEETLELAPNDLQAKALFRVIHREWEERSRRAQVGSLVESARKEIASRRFTAALNVLKEAEALDPNAPDVKSLIESASAGQQQERHKKELESINQQIEEALDRDDFTVAGQKIDEGLFKFPEDRALLKLKALTEKQRQVSERKRFIDEQLTRARALMQTGRNQEVLDLLEAALQQVGNDPHLQSLQVIVREAVEREHTEKRKSELLQRAKECLRRKEFSEAIGILESASTEFQQDADLGDLLQFIREEAAVDERKKAADAIVEKARGLIERDEYDEAVRLLEAGTPESHDEEWRIALAHARSAAADYQKRLAVALSTSRKLLMNSKAVEALRLLESQPNSFHKNSEFNELVQQARREAERLRNIENAVERSRQLAAQRNFHEALRIIDEFQRKCGDASELHDAVVEIEELRSADATAKLEQIMADGRMLMMAKEYRAVLDRLKPAADLSRVASSKLHEEFENLQSQAGAGLVRQRRTQIEHLLRKGEHAEASELLRGSQTEFPDNRSLEDLKQRLDEAVRRRVEVQNLLNAARKLFAEQSWKQGGEACVRAISLASLDPWLREQAIDVAVRAADSALEKDWQAAEAVVHGLTVVKAGSAVPASLRSRIAAKKQEQAVQEVVTEVRRLQARDLTGALNLVGKNLASFPKDADLKNLQGELQQLLRNKEEQERVEQERARRLEQLKTVRERVEGEPALQAKASILEDGLRIYPDETSLQQQFSDLRELIQRLTAQEQKANQLEKSRHYAQAIDIWKEIQRLDPHSSAAEPSIQRIRGLQQEEIEAQRVATTTQARSLIASHDLEAASKILAKAQAEFPNDPQLVKLAREVEERAGIRTQVLQLIAQGRDSAEKKKWDKSADLFRKAAQMAQADPSTRQQAVSALLLAAKAAVAVDWQSARILMDVTAEVEPSSPELEKIRVDIAARKRRAAVAEILASSQKLESAGDPAGALNKLENGLRAYADDPDLLHQRQKLAVQIRAAEAAAQKERRITEHEQSSRRLSDAGDLRAALASANQGLSEFPGEARLMKIKGLLEKSIREADEAARREQERKRQEEEQRRLREEKAAREEEKRKREEAALKLRLEREKEREEQARRKAEEKKLRERNRLANQTTVISDPRHLPQTPLWKRLPALAAIGLVVLVTVWSGVHYLSSKRPELTVQTPGSTSTPIAPQINPLESQQRAALDEADKKRVAGDLPGASKILQNAASLNGPLAAEIQKMQSAVQAEMADDQLRKLRQHEAQLWQEATNDVDRGQFRAAEKSLNGVLALPDGGIRRDEAQKYLREVIPQRMHEWDLLTKAKQAAQMSDQASLTNAASLLDQVVSLQGPRRSEAEQLRRQVQDKLANLSAQQQQKQRNLQQAADLETSARQDIVQGDLASARRKVDQIRQAGGDPTGLAAGIAQAEKAEQSRQQYESNYQQVLQKYQSAGNDKKTLETSRASLQAVAQGGGIHAADARGYVNEIDTKLAALNQLPPPAERVETPASVAGVDDDAAVRSVIKKYEQAVEQRSADAVQAVWPSLGKKRYERFKKNFESAIALHMQSEIEFHIEKVEIGQDRQHATVNAQQLQTNTLQGKAPASRQDKAVFELTKSNGAWVITDVQ